MTKFYRPTATIIAKLADPAWRKDNHVKDSLTYESTYKERNEDPVFRLAARLCRLLAPHMQRFKRTFEEANIPIPERLPLLMFGSTPETIRVFAQIEVPSKCINNLQNTTAFSDKAVLGSFWEVYKADKANERKAAGWDGFNRCYKRLRKSEDIAAPRFVRRYMMPDAKDDAVRDMAEVVVQLRKPLEITWADDKPEDYLPMYLSGPDSCMRHSIPRTFDFLKDKGIHPTSLFAYHPDVKGAYIMKGRVVQARVFCYRETDGIWKYGRIYSANPAILTKFRNNLEELGIQPLQKAAPGQKGGIACMAKRSFVVPGVPGPDGMALPMPYLDNHSPMGVEYNKDTNEFTVHVSQTKGTFIEVGQNGFISVSSLATRRCAVCDVVINRGKGINSHDGNFSFCQPDHMLRHGYVSAQDSEGGARVIDKREAFKDALNNRYYTNREAAVRHGAMEVRDDMFVAEEDDDRISVSGVKVKMSNGVVVSVVENRDNLVALDVIPPKQRERSEVTVDVKKVTTVVMDDQHNEMITEAELRAFQEFFKADEPEAAEVPPGESVSVDALFEQALSGGNAFVSANNSQPDNWIMVRRAG